VSNKGEKHMATTIDPKAGSASMSDIVLESMQELQDSPDSTLNMEPDYLDSPMSDEDVEKELAGTTNPTEEQGSEEQTTASSTNSPVDVVRVELEDGRTAKLKIDFSDKEAVKGFIAEQYASARKAKALEEQLTSIKPDYDDMKVAFEQIESAVENGIEALVDLLYGKPGQFKELIDSEIERRELRKYASEAELAAMDKEEEARRAARLTAAERKKLETEKQAIEAQKSKAAEEALYSRLERQFNQIRVDGLLGDSELEDFVNRAIWRESIDQLSELEAKNPKLPDAAIKQIMNDVASKVRNKFQATQKEATKKAVTNQKTEAQQKVAAKATSTASPSRQQMQESVNSKVDAGDIRGLTRLLLRGQ
jgi:hypothetical protein